MNTLFKCEYCLKTFELSKKRANDNLRLRREKSSCKIGNFCSHQCWSKSRLTIKSFYCKTCGNECMRSNREIRKSKSGFVFCSISCSAIFHNMKRKENIPVKPKPAKRIKHPKGFRKVSNCEECGISFEHRPTTVRKYCSVYCSSKNKYHENSNRVKKCIYKNYQMDSGAELAFAKLLDQYDIQWEKNKYKFFVFRDLEGKSRKYYPDFYLPKYDWWIEIKGKRYSRPDDYLRLESVGNIELIFSHELKLPKCVMAEIVGNAPT
jgi:hypothetical protein